MYIKVYGGSLFAVKSSYDNQPLKENFMLPYIIGLLSEGHFHDIFPNAAFKI